MSKQCSSTYETSLTELRMGWGNLILPCFGISSAALGKEKGLFVRGNMSEVSKHANYGKKGRLKYISGNDAQSNKSFLTFACAKSKHGRLTFANIIFCNHQDFI